jgi:hypothetical protein
MASRKNTPPPAKLEADDFVAIRDVLAHLNFSGGRRDPRFLANLNRLWGKLDAAAPVKALETLLLAELEKLQGTSPVFEDVQQARKVVPLTLDRLLTTYREHQADLLFHLNPLDYEQPLLVGVFFEAVLAQGAPWDDSDRIVQGALKTVNDFVGYRPIPVLESGLRSEIYAHERFRPLPIYMQGVGAAVGPYHDLISATMEFLKQAPKDLLLEAHFDLDQMEELAIDMRSHDHLHPVNKRTNYMFGEWDPHRIDSKGHYRRVVLRRIILDALLAWIDDPKSRTPRAERLFDAAAALCGTMLMASSISGSGPGVHDSSVTLTSLLPVVARRRDAFYQRLMQQVDGPRAKRLKREEQRTQQPFGHIRQFLNMHLAGYGARQIQYREIAYLYAKMGYPDAAREQADAIPAASIRFECEIQCRIGLTHHALNLNRLPEAVELVVGLYDLFQRGIQCGALVDPWNILGFQGQFPLFTSREDTIPDNRVEVLIELIEDTFGAFSRVLSESAAQGNGAARERVLTEYQKVADWWDRFASTTVEDLPKVSGHDSLDAATHVSEALTEWRQAGEAAGDVGFWRQHVEKFESAQAYALVVDALLYRKDLIASLALLMQWLSQSDAVGFESPKHSLFAMLIRWMKLITGPAVSMDQDERANLLRRMFAFLESNADEMWSVPRMEGAVERAQRAMRDDPLKDDAHDEDEERDEDNVFGAAYEEVTYKDTTDDGNWGNTLENDFGFRNTEFEVINREMEPRLKFINAVGQLWQMAGVRLAADLHENREQPLTPILEQALQAVREWRSQAQRWQVDLAELMEAIWDHEIAGSSGEHDANVEYDIQLQVKFYMLHQVINTLICLRNADRLLSGCLPEETSTGGRAEDDPELSTLIRAVVRRDIETVRKSLSTVLEWMSKHALLYVPLDNGGKPAPILRAQMMQSVVRFLLRELPRMGLLFETWRVLQTAFQMERRWRPDGQAITEFDRLFDLALRNVLEEVIRSARTWGDEETRTEILIDAIGDIVEPFQDLWLDHSRTMRISSVDGLRDNDDWLDLADFIREYGGDLLHASQLTLGNVRAILHQGIDWYIDYLEEQQDPLRPMKMLEDLDSGMIDREHCEWCLETIYSIVVDKFDRFLEYNTTTTQSDYGNMFYCLLDFLRLEARYDRDSWSMSPITLVHEMLTRLQETEAAKLWEGTYEAQTTDLAARHLQDISGLQRAYGMRMPTIADHLNQRFIKPLAVNRILALVDQAVKDSLAGVESPSFNELRREVDIYLTDSWGSGVDIPPWLRQLEKEVYDVVEPDEGGRPAADAELTMSVVSLTKDEFQKQLKNWPRRSRTRRPESPPKGKTRRSRKKPPEEKE